MFNDPANPNRNSRAKVASTGAVGAAVVLVLTTLLQFFGVEVPENLDSILTDAIAGLLALALYFTRDAVGRPPA